MKKYQFEATSAITREPDLAVEQNYDLIIIGGGIYGVMLSLISAQKGLRSLLIEKEDFGSGTSYNSLRIVHGGFRYLQRADFQRFFESVNERRWFFQNFHGLVKPLPCLLPLYGNGVYHPSILRVALKINDVLSFNRNKNVHPDFILPSGKVVSSGEVMKIFPGVNTNGLKGGAIWYDGAMPDSQRILIEILKWACSLGAMALNYMEAKEIIIENSIVSGLIAYDCENDKYYKFKSNHIINAAGPWSRELAAQFDTDIPELFKCSIAWNILFDREQLSDYALAVTPERPGARTYFLHPWKGRLLVGTGHAPWSDVTRNPIPPAEGLEVFIDDLNEAIPGLCLEKKDILKIYSGLLPAKKEKTTELSVREVIIDHGERGGIKGLYSLSGVKFTTSRLVAQKTLNKIFPTTKKKTNTYLKQDIEYSKIPPTRLGLFDYNWSPDPKDERWKKDMLEIIRKESVIHLDDLVLRRTSLGDNPLRALQIAPSLCALFDWTKQRCDEEVRRLHSQFKMLQLTEMAQKHFNEC